MLMMAAGFTPASPPCFGDGGPALFGGVPWAGPRRLSTRNHDDEICGLPWEVPGQAERAGIARLCEESLMVRPFGMNPAASARRTRLPEVGQAAAASLRWHSPHRLFHRVAFLQYLRR